MCEYVQAVKAGMSEDEAAAKISAGMKVRVCMHCGAIRRVRVGVPLTGG